VQSYVKTREKPNIFELFRVLSNFGKARVTEKNTVEEYYTWRRWWPQAAWASPRLRISVAQSYTYSTVSEEMVLEAKKAVFLSCSSSWLPRYSTVIVSQL